MRLSESTSDKIKKKESASYFRKQLLKQREIIHCSLLSVRIEDHVRRRAQIVHLWRQSCAGILAQEC